MRKKYLSALLFGALLLASAGTFTSCKDYDDDIKNLQEQINTVKTSLDELTTKVNNLGAGVKEFKYENGKLILVTDKDTNFEVELPACEGIKELTIKNGILYADGVEVGPIGGEGTTIEGDKVEVIDGVLYINGEAKDLKDEVGSNVTVYDNGSTYIMTVDGVSYVLPKASAGLTSLKFENEGKTNFYGVDETYGISWNVAATDVADWKGKKGAVKRNQLLVGQISTVNVQVTPASFDLGSMELSLKDSKGNEAPVKVSAVKNEMLLTRSANTGSWLISIEMNEDVTADNIGTIFDAKGSAPSDANPVVGDANDVNVLYALCVDGMPVSNYDIEIMARPKPAVPTLLGGGSSNWTHDQKFEGLSFVDEDGYTATLDKTDDIKVTDANKGTFKVLPVGETNLTTVFEKLYKDHLYDSYITFEDTNISLANSKGIKADGMTITAPATAAGTSVIATVYFMDITGKVSKHHVGFTVEASTAESIAATPVDYKVMPATVVANQAIQLADIEIKDLTSVFAKIDAATLEKAKQSGKLSIVEEKDQKGFFIANNTTEGVFDDDQYGYYKANGDEWKVEDDDLTELASIKFEMNGSANKVAKDAKPGTYNLYFVVKDENNENEIIRVKMEVKVSKPTFGELFSSNNWVDGKYVARIVASDHDARNWGDENAVINLSKAYVAMPNTKADPAQLAFAFQAIGEGADKKYPVTNLDDAYNADKLNAISGDAGLAILNKEIVYSTDKKSLKLSEIEGMVAYTSVLAGLHHSQVETTQGLNIEDAIQTIQEQFTVSSDAYTTQLVTALNGVKPVFYVDKVDQLANAGYVVALTKDGYITPLTFDGNDQTKPLNGFGFELNGDLISAYRAGSSVASPKTTHLFGAYELDGYALRNGAPSTSGYTLYDVDVKQSASQGTIDWYQTDPTVTKSEFWYKVDGLTNGQQSKVVITLTDATGMIYELPVNVEATNK